MENPSCWQGTPVAGKDQSGCESICESEWAAGNCTRFEHAVTGSGYCYVFGTNLPTTKPTGVEAGLLDGMKWTDRSHVTADDVITQTSGAPCWVCYARKRKSISTPPGYPTGS